MRAETLRRLGAIGLISIPNPKTTDVPWERSSANRLAPAMALADASLGDSAGQQLSVTFNPAHADLLFAGSGHTFAELLALAENRQPLPHFALPASVRARVAVEKRAVESQNVVGLLRGSDPALANEYVVLSAHLDHVGVGAPVNGDAIYNGAMDNASGIATLIEAASAIVAAKPKRSVLFVAVTAEEKGLLGSRYFARNPTVPRGVDRGRRQHGHVPAALSAASVDGAGPRRIRPRRRRAGGGGRGGHRCAGRPAAAAQPLHRAATSTASFARACPRWR